mmetsp:Transcript_76027/g.246765  ORF Transcript_76027/g.246765 Transcript_76027/m.246765 type:complete len:390 (+) Transcript_76027:167-1336(+)
MSRKRSGEEVAQESSGKGRGRRGRTGLVPQPRSERAAELEDEFADNPVVQELRRLDDEYLLLQELQRVERLVLDRKFAQRYAPILERRAQRLAGQGHIFEGHRVATGSIPGFWKTVLQNTDEFQEDIEEHDEVLLDYLRDIGHEYLDDLGLTGFKLILYFEPNPFFTDTELVKVYHTERKGDFIDQLDCVRIEAPKIGWKPGKNVTVELVLRKSKGAGKKKSKARREEVSRPSFFRTFFRNLGPDEEIPEEELEDMLDDEYEEDTQALMDCLLDDDYQQAIALQHNIIPHAIRWFTGAACEDDEDEDDDDEEEEEEEEEGVADMLDDSAVEAAEEARRAASGASRSTPPSPGEARRSGGEGRRRGKGPPSGGGAEASGTPDKPSDCKAQ